LTLKKAWFRSFGPFLQSTVHLHWSKVWNTILNTFVDMSCSKSSKISTHWTAKTHRKIFPSILRMHQLTTRDFLRKLQFAKAQKVLHPPGRLKRAPSDFFLFGYLKE
jgi:hypothetical protein